MVFRCQRWTLANVLPVAFMLAIISIVWTLYLWLHLFPLLQSDASHPPIGCEGSYIPAQVIGLSTSMVDMTHPRTQDCIQAGRLRAKVELAMQQLLTALLVICFFRAVFTDPGSVPNQAEWLPESPGTKKGPEDIRESPEASESSMRSKKSFEVKHTGARRFCKWCNRFKPDRSHHCRVCRSCILRMDHHCPWIANCVGFRNHKFFFLLVFYSLLDSTFVVVTMSESMYRSLVDEMPFSNRFLLVFGMTLSALMGILLMMFFLFHAWLMLHATTTIEFCEKNYRHSGGSHRGSLSIYDRGLYDNVQAVLGPNIFLWLLPLSPPEGDGLYFKVSKEVESSSDSEDRVPLLGPKPPSSSTGPQSGFSISAGTGVSAPSVSFTRNSAGTAENTTASSPPKDSANSTSLIPPEVTGAQQSIS